MVWSQPAAEDVAWDGNVYAHLASATTIIICGLSQISGTPLGRILNTLFATSDRQRRKSSPGFFLAITAQRPDMRRGGRPYGQDRGRDRRTSPSAQTRALRKCAGRAILRRRPSPSARGGLTVGPGAWSGEPHRREILAQRTGKPPRGRSDVLVGLDSPGVQWCATNPPSRCRPTMSRSAPRATRTIRNTYRRIDGDYELELRRGCQDTADAARPSSGGF